MEERQGDIRVPLISFLFCILVTAGGILLCMYAFFPAESQPWFIHVAFLLIGSPWVFWFVMYIYTCFKRCAERRSIHNRQISRRSSMPTATSLELETSQDSQP
ncbi:unnamed protein product [Cuscuta campestris]|uniref:Uncharacterized protein n=1 Tax=Cuscuta campestris TaxID=132261 RepID=A0A484MZT5_9ASTE|nr:unnamed protein product [Cuscuta campestris]